MSYVFAIDSERRRHGTTHQCCRNVPAEMKHRSEGLLKVDVCKGLLHNGDLNCRRLRALVGRHSSLMRMISFRHNPQNDVPLVRI